MSSFQQRLLRDLKASWQKTLLLGLLLLVGMFCWVPPLVKAITKSEPIPNVAMASATGTPGTPLPAASSAKPKSETPPAETSPAPHWKTLEVALKEHPLFQTVNLDSHPRDPFHINQDQFPPPILFVEEAAPTIEMKNTATQLPGQASEELELKSVIIGPSRRAALINGKLCDLGETVELNNQQYLVMRIEPGLVILSSGGKTLELTIRRPGWILPTPEE